MTMDFEEYQALAKGTALYRESIRIFYPALGLAGETGEVAELIKKWLRDEPEGEMSLERKSKLAKELGDVLWYISALCSDLNIDLNAVAEGNIRKLYSRKERGVIHGDGDNR